MNKIPCEVIQDLMPSYIDGLTSPVTSRVVDGQEALGAKFRDYFDYAEPVARMPSHRALAVFRGRTEGVLSVSLTLPEEGDTPESAVAAFFGIGRQVIHSDPILFGAGCPLNASIWERLAAVFINIKGKTVSALLVKGIQHLPHRRRNKVGSAVVFVGIFAETDLQLQA